MGEALDGAALSVEHCEGRPALHTSGSLSKGGDGVDSHVRRLAVNAYRHLDPLVQRFGAFEMSLKKVNAFGGDHTSTYNSLKGLLTLWHAQCETIFGKIAGGEVCVREDLNFNDYKVLLEHVKDMKRIQRDMRLCKALKKAAARQGA